jgi:hypothetical protein
LNIAPSPKTFTTVEMGMKSPLFMIDEARFGMVTRCCFLALASLICLFPLPSLTPAEMPRAAVSSARSAFQRAHLEEVGKFQTSRIDEIWSTA